MPGLIQTQLCSSALPAGMFFRADISNDYRESCSLRCASSECAHRRECIPPSKSVKFTSMRAKLSRSLQFFMEIRVVCLVFFLHFWLYFQVLLLVKLSNYLIYTSFNIETSTILIRLQVVAAPVNDFFGPDVNLHLQLSR